MIDRFSGRLGVSILAVALVAAPVAAKAPSLGDLVGGRASTGQSELESRGYIYISGHESGDYTKHSYYWNSAAKHCAHVVTADGRYTSITDGTRSDCNQKEDNGAGAAVAAVAGAALLAGILSHKSHHKEGATYDQTQTQDFEFGYRDGLYNGSYHNSSRSEAYARGYEQGVNERQANLRHQTGRGGYSSAVRISDIQGMDSIRAFDVMASRGFAGVDSFTTGNTQYGIYYNRNTRQCVQITNADNRVYDIREIGQHPKCR